MKQIYCYLGFFFFLLFLACTEARYSIGVNYGQLGDNLPSPQESIRLVKEMKIGKVKIYDANPFILKELSDTDIKVCVMLPDEQIVQVSENISVAYEFIRTNISSFYPKTKIRMLLVGNEIISTGNNTIIRNLVPAMINLHKAIRKYKMWKIKVSTTLAMDIFNGSVLPPSNASFLDDIAKPIMKPMLSFLKHTRSFFYIDVYPFFSSLGGENPKASLDFALFSPDAKVYKDPNGLEYHNLLDVQLDALSHAMAKLGYPDTPIVIAETGWPSKGELDQITANIHNAALYNRRLVKKVLANPPIGTPLRPRAVLETYIFALYNEDLKPGLESERNWGLLYPNGSHVYEIDLGGYLNESQYKPLPPAPPLEIKLWCVADPNSDPAALGGALSYACGQVDCGPIQPGNACFLPNTTVSHASYAFNDYYNKFQSKGGTCVFGGVANLTTVDPSYGSCKYTPTLIY